MTPLRGPQSPDFLFGLGRSIQTHKDPSALYEEWAREYGSAYRVPYPLGSYRVVLADPKALAAFYARETVVYVRNLATKRVTELIVS
jgi:hypothetical protein